MITGVRNGSGDEGDAKTGGIVEPLKGEYRPKEPENSCALVHSVEELRKLPLDVEVARLQMPGHSKPTEYRRHKNMVRLDNSDMRVRTPGGFCSVDSHVSEDSIIDVDAVVMDACEVQNSALYGRTTIRDRVKVTGHAILIESEASGAPFIVGKTVMVKSSASGNGYMMHMLIVESSIEAWRSESGTYSMMRRQRLCRVEPQEGEKRTAEEIWTSAREQCVNGVVEAYDKRLVSGERGTAPSLGELMGFVDAIAVWYKQ